MFTPHPLHSMPEKRRTSKKALIVWAFCGFILVFSFWSVFVGDWRKQGLPSDDNKTPEPIGPLWKGWDGLRNVFVFGDSFSNTFFDPSGRQPSVDVPFGNSDSTPEIANRDVPKWIQYLRMSAVESKIRVFNFARNGAKIEEDVWEPRMQGTPASPSENSLKQQMKALVDKNTAKKGIDPLRWSNDDSLFILWLGINDIVEAVFKQKRAPLDPIFAAYSASVERLYRYGARNFLIFNIPPLNIAMKANNTVFPEDMGEAEPLIEILGFNDRIANMKDKILRRHSDATVFLFDVHSLWIRALGRPAAFRQTAEVTVTDRWCDAYKSSVNPINLDTLYLPECDRPFREYFWFNELHPAHKVHQLMASALYEDCFQDKKPREHCS